MSIGEAYVSPQIEAALGFSQEEWLEDPVRWYSQIHPEDKGRWSSEAAEMFLTGNPLRSANFLSILGNGKAGTWRPGSGSYVFDPYESTRRRTTLGQVAQQESEAIANATVAIHERLQCGGKLILFGNGGSAPDANDLAIDCVLPPSGYQPIPAVSLSLESANITAVANTSALRQSSSAS